MSFLTNYALFLVKLLTSCMAIGAIITIILKRKSTPKTLKIKKLNQHYQSLADPLNQEILSKQEYKRYKKKQKQLPIQSKHIVVLDFVGDLKASAISDLQETISAILQISVPIHEVVIRLESPGGLVSHYGLAASQLTRLRDHNIRLVVSIDKIAASGGYLMACVADEIIAAPFALVGSIGVITQFPNFNRLLKSNDIDFELLYSGASKRTLTMFGENTEQGRIKMQSQLEDIHAAFKNFIRYYRNQVDINKVGNGDHWLASQAIELNLVDRLISSDDYLFRASADACIYHLSYPIPKPNLKEKIGLVFTTFFNQFFHESLEKKILLK